jgi:hypothetical protein
LLETTDALAQATAILSAYKDPHMYVEAIACVDDETAAFARRVFDREVGDLVSIRCYPPVADDQDTYLMAHDCFVEGLEFEKQPGDPWRARLQLSSADQNVVIPLGGDKAG